MENNFNVPKWDAKSVSGKFIMMAILGGIGLLVWSKIVPLLVNVVWNTVNLAVGLVVGGFVIYTISSKKFWRALKYLSEGISQWTLGAVIEMNPFLILYNRVERAEKDREDLREQAEKLKAQQADLEAQVTENEQIVRDSSSEIKVAQRKLQQSPGDFDMQLALETSTTNYANATDFVNSVKPLYIDITALVAYADKAYRKSGSALQNAKSTIKAQKAKYDAVTTGSNAMKKAMRAFVGDPDLNNDADLALEKLRKDISGKIGGIKQAIQITSQFMNQQDLRDAGKVQQAIDSVNTVNMDQTFGKTEEATPIGAVPMTNKFAEYLKK